MMQVAVIIPVYNAAPYVARAVESALMQPETRQVILVEDGSLDGSLAVCRGLASRNGRVELLQHPGGRNRGAAASRNLGIAAAHCPFVAFLDADDYYLPGRFRTAAKILAAQVEVDGVYDAIGTDCAHPHASRWYRGLGLPDLITVSREVPASRLFEHLVAGDGSYFHGDGLVVRSELLVQTGGFDTSLRIGEDTAMWVKMSVEGCLVPGSLTEPVGMRRIHGDNTIYRARGEMAENVVRMAESLVVWGRSHGLSGRRQRLLLNWLLDFRTDEGHGGYSYARRKARDLGFLASFALEQPRILQSGHFWSLVIGACGWKRFRSLWGGRAHAQLAAKREVAGES